MFCIHCGQKLADNAKFCNKCGGVCGIIENNVSKEVNWKSIEYKDDISGKATWESIENIPGTISNAKIDDDVTKHASWNNIFTHDGESKISTHSRENKIFPYIIPKIIYFKINKDYANEGELLLFSWDTENATQTVISIENIFGSVLQAINVPERTKQYAIPIYFNSETEVIAKLKIYDVAGNKIECKNSFDITKTENSNPIILYFRSDKYGINDHESVTLSWKVKNATQITCSAIEGKLTTHGKETITISFEKGESSKEIYLYAKNEHGEKQETLSIEPTFSILEALFYFFIFFMGLGAVIALILLLVVIIF